MMNNKMAHRLQVLLILVRWNNGLSSCDPRAWNGVLINYNADTSGGGNID
jgi:hypothetical protein